MLRAWREATERGELLLNEEREREEEREVLGERGEEGRGSGFRCVSTLKKKKKSSLKDRLALPLP